MAPPYAGIAAALAARFARGTMTAPTGYRDVRVATHKLPDQMDPLPAVLVFPDGGDFASGNGTRRDVQRWIIRFYYDEYLDLPRAQDATLAWLPVLVDRLQGSVQLGGLVTRAVIDRWKSGVLDYAGQPYVGIELAVSVTADEPWSVTA